MRALFKNDLNYILESNELYLNIHVILVMCFGLNVF